MTFLWKIILKNFENFWKILPKIQAEIFSKMEIFEGQNSAVSFEADLSGSGIHHQNFENLGPIRTGWSPGGTWIPYQDKIEKRNNYDRVEMNLTEKEIDNMPINVMDKV